MKKLILAGILFLLFIVSPAYAYNDGDSQVWNTDNEEFKINDKFKVFSEQEFRWGGNATQEYYQHYDLGAIYSPNKSWDLGASIRHILEIKSNEWRIENDPNIFALLKWKMFGTDLSNRFRLEYRHFDYTTDSWRYRNMLTVRSPWKFTRFEIRPYIADEIFVSSIGAAINNNRAYAGLTFKLNKNVNGELYYMLQNTRTVDSSTGWPGVNVFGSKVKISF